MNMVEGGRSAYCQQRTQAVASGLTMPPSSRELKVAGWWHRQLGCPDRQDRWLFNRSRSLGRVECNLGSWALRAGTHAGRPGGRPSVRPGVRLHWNGFHPELEGASGSSEYTQQPTRTFLRVYIGTYEE